MFGLGIKKGRTYQQKHQKEAQEFKLIIISDSFEDSFGKSKNIKGKRKHNTSIGLR